MESARFRLWHLVAFAVVLVSGCTPPQVAVISVQLESRMDDGGKWDLLGGPPDPYIVVNGRSYRNHACEDSFHCSFRVKGARWYRIEVYDRDDVRDTLAGKVWCFSGQECRDRLASVKVLD